MTEAQARNQAEWIASHEAEVAAGRAAAACLSTSAAMVMQDRADRGWYDRIPADGFVVLAEDVLAVEREAHERGRQGLPPP